MRHKDIKAGLDASRLFAVNKLVILLLYAFLAYASFSGMGSTQRKSWALVFTLFCAVYLLPSVIWGAKLELKDDSIIYCTFVRWQHLPWENVIVVRNVYWFPSDVLILKIKDRPWPFCYILAREEEAARIPGRPFWVRQGKMSRLIRSKIMRQRTRPEG